MKLFIPYALSAVFLGLLAAVSIINTKRCDALQETLRAASAAAEKAENNLKLVTADADALKRESDEKIAILEESIAELGRRFQIVSARDVKMLALGFAQTPRSDADAARAASFAASLKSPASPVAFKSAAEKNLADILSASRELVLDPASGCVVDPAAAILEDAARAVKLAPSTRIIWDSSRKELRTEVTLSDPAKKAKDSVITFGGNPKLFKESTFQLSPKTTIFPFTDLSLLSRSEINILSRAASIPVGGLYIHYFRVYSKGPWLLEYVFPDKLEPESVNMNLLPLTPGDAISSSISGRTFSFHVNVENKETAFLVIADKPFFPDKASIRLKK